MPQADLLHAHRERSFWFGYCHIVLFGAIVATGAGLHAAAYYIEHHSKLGSVEHGVAGGDTGRGRTSWRSTSSTRGWCGRVDPFHLLLLVLTAVVLVAAVLAGRRRHLDGQLPAGRHAGARW